MTDAEHEQWTFAKAFAHAMAKPENAGVVCCRSMTLARRRRARFINRYAAHILKAGENAVYLKNFGVIMFVVDRGPDFMQVAKAAESERGA